MRACSESDGNGCRCEIDLKVDPRATHRATQTAVLSGIPYPLIVWRHLLRNALLPSVAVIAMSLAWPEGGSSTSSVFNSPGVGRFPPFAIDRRDIPLLQVITLVLGGVAILTNVVPSLPSRRLIRGLAPNERPRCAERPPLAIVAFRR